MLSIIHDGIYSVRMGRAMASFAAFETAARPLRPSDLLKGKYLGGRNRFDCFPMDGALGAEEGAMITALGWAGKKGLLTARATVNLLTDSTELIRVVNYHRFSGLKSHLYREYGFIFNEQVRFIHVTGDAMKAFPYIGH